MTSNARRVSPWPLTLVSFLGQSFLPFKVSFASFLPFSTSGAGPGYIYRAICSDDAFDGEGGIGGVRKLVQIDSSELMLQEGEEIPVEGSHRCETYRLNADEEKKLPFPNGTFDLVMSSQALHWVNDLPGLLTEVNVRDPAKIVAAVSSKHFCESHNDCAFWNAYREF